MTKLEIYTQNGCSYCTRAKTLYLSKHEMFPEYDEFCDWIDNHYSWS